MIQLSPALAVLSLGAILSGAAFQAKRKISAGTGAKIGQGQIQTKLRQEF